VFVRNDDNDLVAQEIPLVSPAIRAIVDNILFVSVYGHKSMWETRTRPAFRASVLAHITKEAKDHEVAFNDSWKYFRRRFPLQPEVPAEEDGLDESIMQEFFDDPAPPAPEAEAAAASGNEGD
jgi:hypothetical protein